MRKLLLAGVFAVIPLGAYAGNYGLRISPLDTATKAEYRGAMRREADRWDGTLSGIPDRNVLAEAA